jgi:Uma2 family endonuclease
MPVRRFTVDEYHRLIDEGFFASDERFELLEGLIVEKMSRNPPHDARVAEVRRVLDRRLPPGWHVRVQSAITTADSEPEPELAIVAGTELTYEHRHPGPGDVALLVEVANTSLVEDRDVKGRIYARAGVPTYWIVNLQDRRLEVYTLPSGTSDVTAYASRVDYTAGQSVPLSIGGAEAVLIPVSDLIA